MMMTPESLSSHLLRLGACDEALAWSAGMSGETVWNSCPRGDWLIWLAAVAGVNAPRVILAACDCARLAVSLGPDAKRTIETVEKWAAGKATASDVELAVCQAITSADSAAAHAALAVGRVGDSLHFSRAVSIAASAAAGSDISNQGEILQDCADAVRARVSWEEVSAGLGG